MLLTTGKQFISSKGEKLELSQYKIKALTFFLWLQPAFDLNKGTQWLTIDKTIMKGSLDVSLTTT